MATFKDGYKAEAVRGTNTIADFIELATYTYDKKMPIEASFTAEYNSLESVGSDLAITKGNHPLDRVTVSEIGINELPFYWMFGAEEDGTGDYTGEKVIEFSGGDKPSISLYHWMNNRAWVGKGCVLNSLDFDLNFGKALTYKYSAKGMSQEVSSTSLTLTTPSTITTYNGLSVFTFNSATYDIANVGGKFQQDLQPLIGTAGYYQAITDTSKITGVIQVMFKPDLDLSALYTLLALSSDTVHAFEFTISDTTQPTAKYIRIEGNALLYDIVIATNKGEADQHVGFFVLDGTTKVCSKGGALT